MGSKRRTKIDINTFTRNENAVLKEEGNDFEKCLKMFLVELEIKNLSYHTRRWHRENIKGVIKALRTLNLPIQPNKVTSKDIKECILYWKRELKNSPITINHRIRSLKQLYQFLINEEIVGNSPVKEIDKLKSPKTIIRPFEEDELRKLFAQPNKSTFVGFRDYTIMLLLLDTGIRLIEIESIKVTDVDFKNNKILVFGKGSKEREVYFQKTTKECLKRYLLIRGELDHDSLFVNNENSPMLRRNFEQRLTIYGEKAGLTKVRVSPHTFRHTCAKQYITKGGDILSLQKLLGHSTLEMVRHYVNLWGSDLQQMHKRYSPVESLLNRG